MAKAGRSFHVLSRVHDLPRERQGYAAALLLALPLGVAAALRSAHVYQANAYGVALAIPIVLALVAAYLISTEVVVGADAVSMQWLWRLEVVPLREIARVEMPSLEAADLAPAQIRLVRHDGTEHTIRIGRHDPQRHVLVRSIRAALLARDGLPVDHDAAALGRGGRDAVKWTRALRAMSGGAEGTHRAAPFPAERLRAIIENVDAPALDRATAAVALAPVATSEDRTRIRSAAVTSADPLLRTALQRALEEAAEDETLAAALLALEQERR